VRCGGGGTRGWGAGPRQAGRRAPTLGAAAGAASSGAAPRAGPRPTHAAPLQCAARSPRRRAVERARSGRGVPRRGAGASPGSARAGGGARAVARGRDIVPGLRRRAPPARPGPVEKQGVFCGRGHIARCSRGACVQGAQGQPDGRGATPRSGTVASPTLPVACTRTLFCGGARGARRPPPAHARRAARRPRWASGGARARSGRRRRAPRRGLELQQGLDGRRVGTPPCAQRACR
jgi:hypothetical protein